MIKFLTHTPDGGVAMWLGLSSENLARLQEEPILFEMSELDTRHIDRVVLVAGPTEQVIAERLRHMGVPIPEFEQPQPGESVVTHGS